MDADGPIDADDSMNADGSIDCIQQVDVRGSRVEPHQGFRVELDVVHLRMVFN